MPTEDCLLLAGCGKMGSALVEGWLRQGIRAENVFVVEPNQDIAAHLTSTFGISASATVESLPETLAPLVVMMAVKPQVMDTVAPAYAKYTSPNTVFLSIAAGKTIAYFEGIFGSGAAVVRSMPNTPASVSRGITVCCGNPHVSPPQKDLCSKLLQAVGSVDWVAEEGLIDAVTAVSGGGPAYVFLLSESLAVAGIAAGLPEDLAWRLARETVAGSGELLFHSSEEASTLRKNVTSPGGTTAEALKVLMGEDGGPGWQTLINDAVQAATKRSRELAG